MSDQSYDLSAYPLFRSVIGNQGQKAKSRRCFVIDPSHDADASVRAHADTLWKYVIQPAVLDTDYAAYRADRSYENAPTDQAAINAVLDDDLIIAVPSFGNARVFYETALAQAAARPLILMIEEGQDLGFDPRNAEVITYRLDTESVVSAVNVERLQTVIRELDMRGRPACHGFRPGTAALNGGCEDSVTVFERSPRFSYDRRLEVMRGAKTRIDVMGVANLALALHPDTTDVVLARGARGVEIRILQCAPTNPGLISLVGARNAEQLDAIKREIDSAADAWRRIADAAEREISITVRRAQTSLPLSSALITDRAVVTTPYLHSRTTAESPTVFARAGDPFHHTMTEEFSVLWAEATTVFRIEPGLAPATHTSSGRALNGARHHEPELEHTADTAHHSLFGRTNGDSAKPSNGARLKSHPPRTTNDRGHAIIRSVG